jgi:hypothetical protein
MFMGRKKPSPQPKKPGPPKRGYGHAHILLPPDLIEWAKHHPEGLSGLVRRLLAQERDRLAAAP